MAARMHHRPVLRGHGGELGLAIVVAVIAVAAILTMVVVG